MKKKERKNVDARIYGVKFEDLQKQDLELRKQFLEDAKQYMEEEEIKKEIEIYKIVGHYTIECSEQGFKYSDGLRHWDFLDCDSLEEVYEYLGNALSSVSYYTCNKYDYKKLEKNGVTIWSSYSLVEDDDILFESEFGFNFDYIEVEPEKKEDVLDIAEELLDYVNRKCYIDEEIRNDIVTKIFDDKWYNQNDYSTRIYYKDEADEITKTLIVAIDKVINELDQVELTKDYIAIFNDKAIEVLEAYKEAKEV